MREVPAPRHGKSVQLVVVGLATIAKCARPSGQTGNAALRHIDCSVLVVDHPHVSEEGASWTCTTC